MAIVFIHGVNTRDGSDYRRGLAARDHMMRRLLLQLLRGGNHREAKIHNVYWGDLGVEFRWNLATIPQVRPQGGGSDTPASDEELLQFIGTDVAVPNERSLRPMGSSNPILSGARKDAAGMTRALLAPIAYGERAGDDEAEDPEVSGRQEALLLEAADQMDLDPSLSAKLAAAVDDDEALEALRDALSARFHILAEPAQGKPALPPGIRSQGGQWDAVKERVEQIFDHARSAPGRAASGVALRRYRRSVHERFARFFGDVFVYLDRRKSADPARSIPLRVLDTLRKAREEAAAGEPLIVMTHSMGGNIFYDIATHFAKDFAVDAWISVGGQVGQLEEMKVFLASDDGVKSPHKVAGVSPPVRAWLNVYDPIDPFAFKASPVFAAISPSDDVPFDTGGGLSDAHGAYFLRPGFYQLCRDWLEKVLP